VGIGIGRAGNGDGRMREGIKEIQSPPQTQSIRRWLQERERCECVKKLGVVMRMRNEFYPLYRRYWVGGSRVMVHGGHSQSYRKNASGKLLLQGDEREGDGQSVWITHRVNPAH